MIKLMLLVSIVSSYTASAQIAYLAIGTYDSPKSEGIYLYSFNEQTGSAKMLGLAKISNPSYLAISANKKFIFAVNENANNNGKGGFVTSFLVNESKASLSKISSQSTEGSNPCYVSIDKTGKWLAVANYSSGSFVVLPIYKNGQLGKAVSTTQLLGSGPLAARQEAPHAHTAVFDNSNKLLYITDLGTDKVMLYQFNPRTGAVKPAAQPELKADPASGPRHIALSKNGRIMYVVNELSATINVYSKANTKDSFRLLMQSQKMVSTNEEDAGSADIHLSPDEKFLYATIRGSSNTISYAKINSATGEIGSFEIQSTLGIKPRNFSFNPSGKYILVANQSSDEVVIFKRDSTTGKLTDTGKRIKIGKPVCIKFF